MPRCAPSSSLCFVAGHRRLKLLGEKHDARTLWIEYAALRQSVDSVRPLP